jgi:hypothetical protein
MLPQRCPGPHGSPVPATPPEPALSGVDDVSVPEQPGNTAAEASALDAKDNNKYGVRLFAILLSRARAKARADHQPATLVPTATDDITG